MKKVLGLLSSLLIFGGVKAQTPTVKKETVKPSVIKPTIADSLKSIKGNTTIKAGEKAIKFDHIKQTNTLPMKELPVKDFKATAKPDKH
jgi:hypothetical protein